MSSSEGRFDTRGGPGSFPGPCIPLTFLLARKRSRHDGERFPTSLCPACASSQAMILSNLNSHQFVMLCTLFFDWSLRCLLVWYFFFTTLNRKWCFTPFSKKIYQTISSKYILLGFVVIVRFKKPDESCGEELM